MLNKNKRAYLEMSAAFADVMDAAQTLATAMEYAIDSMAFVSYWEDQDD